MKNTFFLIIALFFFASCGTTKTGCPYWTENTTIEKKEEITPTLCLEEIENYELVEIATTVTSF